MGYLTMNRKEREQAKVFERVKGGLITQVEAAARLRVTDRWVRSKIKRYYQLGDSGLIHRSRGSVSPRKWDIEQEQFLMGLLRGGWHGFGPTFAAEKLEEIHGIKISREVIRKSMIKEGLWEPKRKRSKHRKRRERKPMLGMMIQLDGSPHDWFEGRAEKCVLLVYIDDATSKILWLEFARSESVKSLVKATQGYVQAHGIPASFYTDFGSAFHVNLNNPEGVKKTQWERACAQLGIIVHHAHSSQAKGRVERCNETMQDRLTKEMRLAGISSIESANEYLRTSNFIARHNAKFAVKAAQNGDAHADWRIHNLHDVFSIQTTRTLMNDFTIAYKNNILQLHSQQKTIIRPKDVITVKIALEGKISLWIRDIKLAFSRVDARPVQEKTSDEKVVNLKPYKPSQNSRRWVGGLLPITSRVKPAAPAVEAS